jgi:tetratricopeptide (TPR) repeat protein
MLFDLQSPGRRRVLKVVYGALAAIFLVGFVGFGIGTSGSGGGLLDSITGGGGGGDASGAFEDDIDAAQARLQQNPKDAAALSELVSLHYQAGSQQIQVDQETGEQSITTDGEEQLNEAADAWAKYLKLSGGDPNKGTASLAVQTFSILSELSLKRALGDTDETEALSDVTKATAAYIDAAEAQRILADADPNVQAYANLAFFLYRSGDIAAGDAATQQAVALAKGPEAEQVKTALEQTKKQGDQINQAVAQLQKTQQTSSATGGGGENPLSGISGGGFSAGGLGGQ